jgi:large subunit ribosomal protein L32
LAANAPCRLTDPHNGGTEKDAAILAFQGNFAAGEKKGTAMPNPKRRHSARRTSIRRAHDFLTATGVSECPNCHEKKLPHRACPKCGTYKGREVLKVKEAEK